jgi:hypothetical protein
MRLNADCGEARCRLEVGTELEAAPGLNCEMPFIEVGIELEAAPRLNYKWQELVEVFNRIRYKDTIKGY